MKTRKILLILLIAILALSVLALTACDFSLFGGSDVEDPTDDPVIDDPVIDDPVVDDPTGDDPVVDVPTDPDKTYYTVTFNVNGGSVVTSIQVESGLSIVLPTAPTLEDYTFVGWYTDADLTVAFDTSTLIDADTTLYAKWIEYSVGDEDKTFSITWCNSDGVVLLQQTVAYGEQAEYTGTEPNVENTAQYTYTFTGWDTVPAVVTADATYTAQYETTLNQYTIAFDCDGGDEVSSQAIYYGYKVTTPTEPTREGYNFVGWYEENSNTSFDFDSAVTCDVELIAKWTAIEYSIIYVGFEGATNTNVSTYTIEDSIEFVLPTKAGYTVTLDVTSIAKGSTGAVTVTASWTAIEYSITYVGFDGVTNDNTATTYTIESDTIEFVVPTKTGYTATLDVSSIAKGSTGAVTVTATWQEYTTAGLSYTLNSDGLSYTVSGIGTATDTDIFIPSTYNNLPVTRIGDSAFKSCTSLTGLVIPDSVTSIGDLSFCSCSSLQKLTIGSGVTVINRAFCDCTSLEIVYYNATNATCGTYWPFSSCGSSDGCELVIGDNVENIDSYMFYDFDYLTAVTIGDSVTSIGDYAFRYCSNLTSVTIGDSVTRIGVYAFSGCSSLTSVTIGNSVTSIYSNAFYDCDSLTSVIIPDSVASIGFAAFSGCTSLTSVTIGSGVTYMGMLAFSRCTSLEAIYYYATCATCNYGLSYEAFANSGSSTNGCILIIGNNVESVSDYMFYNFDYLTSVTIGSGVTSIGYFAFQYCTSLETVYYNATNATCSASSSSDPSPFKCSGSSGACELIIGDNVESIGRYMFSGFDYLTSVVIPDSVISIGDYAFYSCDSLTSVTIGKSVTSIGGYAFLYCNNLVEIYNLSSLSITAGSSSYGDVAYYALIVHASSEDESILFVDNGGFITYTDGDGVILVGYTGTITDITIPSSVTGIRMYAFYDDDNITSVVIPDSVTSIGEYAFRYCSSLTIHCEVSTQPSGWDSDWNSSDCPVVWGYNNVTSVEPEGTYDYVLKNGNAHITAYNGTDTDVVVPDAIDGYAVVSIGGAFNCNADISSVTIPDTVVSLDRYAFYCCTSLTSVTIGNSVTSIGSWSFYGCSSLTDVYYKGIIEDWCDISFSNSSANPMYYADNLYMLDDNGEYYDFMEVTNLVISDSVVSIGSYAFYGCISLTSVVIPDSVTSIGSYAFSDCSSLTSVVIPDSVTSIGKYAFRYCSSLESITLPFVGDSATSSTHFGYLFGDSSYLSSSSGTTNVPSSLTSVTITGGSIANYAFRYMSNITTVVLGDAVTSIGSSAFESCSRLSSVTIGKLVTSIGSNAFSYCGNLVEVYNLSILNITAGSTAYGYVAHHATVVYCSTDSLLATDSDGFVTYTDGDDVVLVSYIGGDTDITIPSSITKIYQCAFYNNDNITSVTIPDSVTSIGSYAFYYCSSLTSVVIPDSVTSIGDAAFQHCSGLTSITIPDSVISMGSYAFQYCTSLETVYYNATNATCSTSSSYAPFRYSGSDANGCTLIIDDNVESIGSCMFSYFDDLTSVVIGDSVTSIGSYAFYGCDELTSVVIPDSVTSIGYCAFYGCTSLTSITIPDSVTSIGDYAFKYCSSLASITIPDSVTIIGEGTFGYCTSLQELTIGSGVVSINTEAFQYCTSLETVHYNATNATGSYVFQYSGSEDNGCELIIGDNVESIGSYMFYDFDYLTAVTIGYSVTSIDNYAFRNCTSLTSVTIGDSVTRIGVYAFSGCSSLTSVTIGDSVTSIGESAFRSCISLTSITIPDSVTYIGSYAFMHCSGLTSVIIGESVTMIDTSAFGSCTSLETVYFNATNVTCVTSSSDAPFKYSGSSTNGCELIVGDNVKSIGSYMFCGFNYLTSVIIPDSVTSIGSSAFYGCSALESITLPFVGTTLNEISNTHFGYIFGDSSYLSSSSSTTNVPSSLISVTITGGSINSYAFQYMDNITTIVLGDSITSIGNYAFRYCSSLFSVVIPDSVVSIGYYAFYGCSSLFSVVIPDSVTSIGNYAFYDCSNLQELTIGSGVTSIGSYAFQYCTALETVYYNATNATCSTSSYAPFRYSGSEDNGCELIIGDNVGSIGRHMFYYFDYLTSVTIGFSITSIGDDAFWYCTSLTDVYYNGTLADWCGISFVDNSSNPMYYADNLYMLDDKGEYYNFMEVTNLAIPDSVTSIGSYAFLYCDNLTSVTIGDSVTSIGDDAFWYCTSLTDVYYNGTIEDWCGISFSNSSANPMYYADNLYMLDDNGEYYNFMEVTNLVISDSVISLGSYVFYNCSSLNSVTIPDSVITIGEYAFYNCSSLTDVYYKGIIEDWCDISFSNSSANPMYYADNLYMLDDNGEYYDFMEVTNLVISDSVVSIGSYAFYGCISLTSVVIPDSVTSIGSYAFSDCSSLTSVTIPDSVTNIGSYAFYGCSSLTSVVIPDSVTSIGYRAFYSCSSLTSVVFEDASIWYRTTSSSNASSMAGGTSTSVTSSSTAATYLVSTYYNYYWYKK